MYIVKSWENKNVLSFIFKVDRFMVIRMSYGRLFHNFEAMNIKAWSPRVFDDFISGKWSKVQSQEHVPLNCYLFLNLFII